MRFYIVLLLLCLSTACNDDDKKQDIPVKAPTNSISDNGAGTDHLQDNWGIYRSQHLDSPPMLEP